MRRLTGQTATLFSAWQWSRKGSHINVRCPFGAIGLGVLTRSTPITHYHEGVSVIASSDRWDDPGDSDGQDTGGRPETAREDRSPAGDDHERHDGFWRKWASNSDMIVKVAIVTGTLIGAASFVFQLVH